MNQVVTTKKCSKCQVVKPLSNFHSNLICVDCNKIIRKQYRLRYQEKTKVYNALYRMSHKDSRRIYSKQYNSNNRDKINNYLKIKMNVDQSFKLRRTITTRILHAIKNNKRQHNIFNLIGCTIDEYKIHLQSLFKSDMTWENHGKVWHIDHRIPINFFNLEDGVEQIQAFYYKNCQPMYIEENLNKRDKLLPEYASYLI